MCLVSRSTSPFSLVFSSSIFFQFVGSLFCAFFSAYSRIISAMSSRFCSSSRHTRFSSFVLTSTSFFLVSTSCRRSFVSRMALLYCSRTISYWFETSSYSSFSVRISFLRMRFSFRRDLLLTVLINSSSMSSRSSAITESRFFSSIVSSTMCLISDVAASLSSWCFFFSVSRSTLTLCSSSVKNWI